MKMKGCIKMENVLRGTVKFFKRDLGYGFITSGKVDYYFRTDQCKEDECCRRGVEVEFGLKKTDGRFEAIDVHLPS